MKDQKKEKKKGSFLRTVILLIAVGVFCYSGYQLLTIYFSYKKGTDEYAGLEQYAEVEEVEEPETEGGDSGTEENSDEAKADTSKTAENGTEEDTEEATEAFTYVTETDKDTGETEKIKLYYMKNPVDFESLKEINEDIIGWLKIGALDISYPIAQGEDNDYYLHRTFAGEDNFAGCIFMDYQNSPDLTDDNTIIYGHNMKNGSMFGMLKHFLNDGVYDSDEYFWIFTPDRIYKYHIFNCTTVGAVSSTYTLKFASDEDFQDYLDVAAAQSQVDSSHVEVTSDDTIVTLSTCTGDSSTRFVVQGKLARTYVAINVKKDGSKKETETTAK